MPKITREELHELWRRQEEREAQRRERIRQAVKTSSVPLPSELAQALIRLNDEHTRAILRDHPGFPLAGRRDSYLISLAVAEQSLEDLLAAISSFEAAALAENSNLLSRRGESELRIIERRIQKELFACANAAASLVDHARRVNKILEMPDYETQRAACFGIDGLHDFVIALRVMLHHLHMVEAGWNVTRRFSEGTAAATFTVSKATVQRVIAAFPERFGRKSDDAMNVYVNAASETIDLRDIFLEYRARMSRFHEWMKSELESTSLVALRDYDDLLQRKVNADQLMFWKAMMGNWLRWKSPPNPHKHLPRFLTPEQLEEVYKLPRNSRDQVDLVISYLDTNNAVDDALRKEAYELFERSPPSDTALLASAQ